MKIYTRMRDDDDVSKCSSVNAFARFQRLCFGRFTTKARRAQRRHGDHLVRSSAANVFVILLECGARLGFVV